MITLMTRPFLPLVILVIITLPLLSRAEMPVKEVYIEDTTPPISTPRYSPALEDFSPPLGTYAFSISWGGVHAGTAVVGVEKDHKIYQIRVKAKSSDMVDKLYKLRYRGEALLSAEDLSPIKTYLVERKKNKKKETEITFHSEGEIDSVRHKYKDKTKRKTEFRILLNRFGTSPMRDLSRRPASILSALSPKGSTSDSPPTAPGWKRNLASITVSGLRYSRS